MSCGAGRIPGPWRQARQDALAWRIRLGETQVSTETLKRFSEWYRGALNRRAWEAEGREAQLRASAIL